MATTLGLLYVLLYAFPPSKNEYSGPSSTITINRWWEPLGWATAALLLVNLVLSFRWQLQRRVLWWVPLSFALAGPLLCCGGLFNGLISYGDLASVKDRDGTEYHLLGQSFLQGSDLAIGRLQSRFGFLEQYEVIVTSPWEQSFGYLEVVRPEDRVTEEAGLWLTKDRVLVGLPYGNDAYLAYDLEAKRPYSQIFNSNELNYTDIRNLSPFLLLKSGDVPSERDFKELLNPESYGYPDKFAVDLDLYQSDPLRVSLARKLLPFLKKNPPKR